jgi:endonuclease YncB( thermonuclease family)
MTNYIYQAKVIRVVDGDTFVCDINLKSRINSQATSQATETIAPEVLYDLGFGFWSTLPPGIEIWHKKVRIRLYGINAPEKFGVQKSQGLRSKEYLKQLIEGKEICLETIKDKCDDFGRYLGIAYFQGVNINEKLVTEGYAQRKIY